MENDKLRLICTGIEDDGKVPIENTGRGQDRSPEFVLQNLSPQAKTIAIILEDLSHPIKNFTHWLIWNIPAAEHIPGGIPEGSRVPELGGACQGVGYGFHRYAGPKPPKGNTHKYRFTVYALDCDIQLSAHALKKTFLKKAESHILQKGSVTARFE